MRSQVVYRAAQGIGISDSLLNMQYEQLLCCLGCCFVHQLFVAAPMESPHAHQNKADTAFSLRNKD